MAFIDNLMWFKFGYGSHSRSILFIILDFISPLFFKYSLALIVFLDSLHYQVLMSRRMLLLQFLPTKVFVVELILHQSRQAGLCINWILVVLLSIAVFLLICQEGWMHFTSWMLYYCAGPDKENKYVVLGEKAKAQLLRDSKKDIELSITELQKYPLNYTQVISSYLLLFMIWRKNLKFNFFPRLLQWTDVLFFHFLFLNPFPVHIDILFHWKTCLF